MPERRGRREGWRRRWPGRRDIAITAKTSARIRRAPLVRTSSPLAARSKNPDFSSALEPGGAKRSRSQSPRHWKYSFMSASETATPSELCLGDFGHESGLGDVELVGEKSAQRPLDFRVKTPGRHLPLIIRRASPRRFLAIRPALRPPSRTPHRPRAGPSAFVGPRLRAGQQAATA